jgi:hypothetical protein
VTSAVLDVTLCLLFVSAAAVTLVAVPGDAGGDGDGDRADVVATTLTTSTATVNYSLAPGARDAEEDDLASFPTTSGAEFERSTHGTLAGLLADAAVGTTTVDGEQLTHTDDGFRDAVRARLRQDVADGRVQLLAHWMPYRGSHLRGGVTVGPSPPPDAAVHAATVSVPSGLSTARDEADEAAVESGFEGVARVVAEHVVTGLFPPDGLRFALRGDYPVSQLARYRYHRAEQSYEVGVADDDGEVRPHEANDRLTDAVADVVERDLRRTFENPSAAAESVRVDEVRIVVRTWST